MKPPVLEVVSAGAELDPEIERLLHAARESAEPLLENRARVSRALEAALPVSLGALLPSGAPSVGAAIGSTVRPAASASGVWLRSAGLLVGGLLLGGLGFWLGHDRGYSRGVADALREQLGQVSARERSPGGEGKPTTSAQNVPASSAQGSGASEAPVERAPQHAPPRRRPPRPPAPSSSAAGERGPASAASAPAHSNAASLTFRQVLEQLRRARQQLQSGQALTSLLILSELERGAGELLVEERAATRVLALCAVGQESAAREVAARLEQSSPGSIYSMRLAQSCAGSSQDSSNGEGFGHAREE